MQVGSSNTEFKSHEKGHIVEDGAMVHTGRCPVENMMVGAT